MNNGDLKIIIGVVTFFILIECGRYYHNKHLMITGAKTTCTITAANSKNIKVAFKANGETYENTLSNPCSCLYQGEAYALVYNPDNPKESTILFWQPIFNKNLYTGTVTDEVHTVWNTSYNKTITFKYTANGKSYERYQGLAPTKEKLPTKQKSKVYYNSMNPAIAYIEY